MIKGDKVRKNRDKARDNELYFLRTDSPFSVNPEMQQGGNQTPLALHRPRIPRNNGKNDPSTSELDTAFDPMKDLHMWTMWRTAVNGRIVDEVRRMEKAKAENPKDIYYNGLHGNISQGGARSIPPYGKALSGAPPLSRFIRLDDQSKSIAQRLVMEGKGQLKRSQFIYYGLPRVVINVDSNRDTH